MTSVSSFPTEVYLANVQSSITEMEELARKMSRATTPKGIQGAQQEIFSLINDLGPAGDEWSRSELLNIFNKGREASGGGASKSLSARALRERKKAQQGLLQGQLGLRQWATQRGDDVQILKAKGLIEKQLAKAELVANKFPDNPEAAAKVAELQGQLDKLPKASNLDTTPRIPYRDKNGKITSYQPAWRHWDMSTRTGRAMQQNLGVIAGAPEDSWFIVGDGPDCGWPLHDSGGMANGKVVSRKEAISAPLAHPNCQREFELADGPPRSKALRQQLKNIVGTAERRKIDRVARVGHIFADVADGFQMALRLTSGARNSSTVQFLTRQISMSRPDLLPNWALKDIQVWEAAWGGREVALMTSRGVDVAENMRSFVAVDILNEALPTEKFQALSLTREVTEDIMPDDTLRLLGLERGATKLDVLSRAEDYADYVIHRRSTAMDPAEILQNNLINVDAVNSNFVIDAMKLPFNPPRGAGIRARKYLTDTYTELMRIVDSEEGVHLTTALVEDVARYIDVLPWPRANVGPFRLGIGIHADGRADLASKVFKALRESRMYSNEELSWARSIGLHVGRDALTPRNVIDAMLPRVSMGGHGHGMYFTMSYESGKIVPIFRMHPPGAIMRNFAIRANLPRKPVREYIQFLAEQLPADGGPGAIRNTLKALDPDTLWTIDIFRHSPVQASLRLKGGHFEDWAIKTRPDKRWMGKLYKMFGEPFFELTPEEKVYHYLRLTQHEGYTPDQAIDMLHLFSFPARFKERIFAPRLTSRIRVNNIDDDVIENLMRLYAWNSDIYETARESGITLKQMLEIYAQHKTDFDATWDAFNLPLSRGTVSRTLRSGTTNVKIEAGIYAQRARNALTNSRRRFNGSVKKLEDIPVVRTTSLDDRQKLTTWRTVLDDARRSDDSYDKPWDFFDDAPNVEQAFLDDMNDAYSTWSRVAPDVEPPPLLINGQIPQESGAWIPAGTGYTPAHTGYIQFDVGAASRWTGDFSDYFYKAGKSGYGVYGDTPVGVFWHEAGHYLNNYQSFDDFADMWDEVLGIFQYQGPTVREMLGDAVDSLNHSYRFHAQNNTRIGLEKMIWEAFLQTDEARVLVSDAVSDYATYSPRELIAELFHDYMMNRTPSEAAQAVGSYLRKAGKDLK